jgi:hypothetical protein
MRVIPIESLDTVATEARPQREVGDVEVANQAPDDLFLVPVRDVATVSIEEIAKRLGRRLSRHPLSIAWQLPP